MTTLILSSVLELLKISNGRPQIETLRYARNRVYRADTRNYGITYGIGNDSICLNKAGDGVVIVERNRRATVSSLGLRYLSSKAARNGTRGSDDNCPIRIEEVNIKSISNTKNLVAAYELIKSKPGNMTEGADQTTLDGISLKYIENTQSLLKAGKFKFSPARRVQIPKPGKKETRPLTIASPREKVVQKAIQLILERVYEPKFHTSSHGFRPNRGTHTAMLQVDAQFQSVKYVIEADFSKAFDSIPHKELMNILKEDIQCQKTLALIKSGLQAGFIEFGTLHNNLALGTPQGSILSPLLCNIFLNKLD